MGFRSLYGILYAGCGFCILVRFWAQATFFGAEIRKTIQSCVPESRDGLKKLDNGFLERFFGTSFQLPEMGSQFCYRKWFPNSAT